MKKSVLTQLLGPFSEPCQTHLEKCSSLVSEVLWIWFLICTKILEFRDEQMKTHWVHDESAELRYKASPDSWYSFSSLLWQCSSERGRLPPGWLMSRRSIKTSGRGKHMSVRPDYTRRAGMEPLGDTVWASSSHIWSNLGSISQSCAWHHIRESRYCIIYDCCIHRPGGEGTPEGTVFFSTLRLLYCSSNGEKD